MKGPHGGPSFEAIPFAQFHSRPLKHIIMLACNKHILSLDFPACLSSQEKLLKLWSTSQIFVPVFSLGQVDQRWKNEQANETALKSILTFI